MKKSVDTPASRTVILDEKDWEWFVGWMETLLRAIAMDEMSTDSLRMGGILKAIKRAKPTPED